MEEKSVAPASEKYAIFQTGGKQYFAIPGKTIAVEKLEGNVGDTLEFSEVLFRKKGENQYEFGKPYIDGVKLKASIVKQMKGPKIIVFRHKRRKKSRVKKGHRQPYTVLEISDFLVKASAKKAATKQATKTAQKQPAVPPKISKTRTTKPASKSKTATAKKQTKPKPKKATAAKESEE